MKNIRFGSFDEQEELEFGLMVQVDRQLCRKVKD
jgi:hypothetical protein